MTYQLYRKVPTITPFGSEPSYVPLAALVYSGRSMRVFLPPLECLWATVLALSADMFLYKCQICFWEMDSTVFIHGEMHTAHLCIYSTYEY